MADAPQANGKDELIDERKEPYAMVEVWVLRNPEITPQCKALYGLLITYGPDRIFPGHERLAYELGVTRQTISKWLRDLKELGLIDWQRTGRSNRYRILGPPRCKAGHTSDVKQGIHLIPTETDNRCMPELTRSRSKELDPSTPDPIISPPPAENLAEPDSLPTTDNPNSITNRPVDSGDEHQGGNASTGSYGGDVLRRANGGESWTVPAEAGGTDSFKDGLVDTFCQFVCIPASSLSKKKRGQWASEFRKMAADWDVGADALIACIQAMPKSEFDFKSYSTPYQDSFQNDLFVLISRHKGGQPLVEENPRASPSRKRGKRRDATDEWPTEVERQATWQQYGEWMLEWIRTRAGPPRDASEVAAALKLPKEVALALFCEWSAREAARAEPVDVEAVLGAGG